MLTDIYLDLVEEDGTFSSNNFVQQDFTCPFLCEDHAQENHAEAEGLPIARGRGLYPYSN